jgi:PTH1 family peptidyl-tRNA hydrolase
MIKLIVGLGNPGSKHETDRHNAGFWFVSLLAKQTGVSLEPEKRFHGKVAKASLHGRDVWLLQPDTFMNLSGQSVGALCRFHQILPEEILVAHDELDLKAGVARLKFSGGTGGHNGLKDILAHLSSPDYWRLRIGIGHPRDLPGRLMDVADFVLRKPLLEEQIQIDEALSRSLDAMPLFLAGDTATAMKELHSSC